MYGLQQVSFLMGLYNKTQASVMQQKRKREADDDDEQLAYEQAKKRHELECFELHNHIGTFAVLLADKHVPKIMSRAMVRRYYDDNFIKQWFRDEDMRTVETIVVDPSGTSGENVFNIWKPFRASELTAVVDSVELVEPIVSYIHKHIANSDEGLTEWILNYIARILQFPESKSEMAIWLYGDERCGKSLLFDFFCEQVLGQHSSLQLTNQVLHESSAVGRVCIQVHGVKRLHKRIHDLIMMKTLYLGNRDVCVANLVNLVVTSNNPPPEDDIHIAEFKCSVPADLDGLRAHLQRADVARAFYQYLMERPLPTGAGFRKFMRHSHPRLIGDK